MATLLTDAQRTELRAVLNLYRGIPTASHQGIVPDEVVQRVARVMAPAMTAVGATVQLQQAITHISEQPWLYFASLLTFLDYAADDWILDSFENWTFWEWVLIPSLTAARMERSMGLPDGLAVGVAKALSEIPNSTLAADTAHSGGISILEAVKQAPIALMLGVILDVNATRDFIP
jgi:hypothetical protein